MGCRRAPKPSVQRHSNDDDRSTDSSSPCATKPLVDRKPRHRSSADRRANRLLRQLPRDLSTPTWSRPQRDKLRILLLEQCIKAGIRTHLHIMYTDHHPKKVDSAQKVCPTASDHLSAAHAASLSPNRAPAAHFRDSDGLRSRPYTTNFARTDVVVIGSWVAQLARIVLTHLKRWSTR